MKSPKLAFEPERISLKIEKLLPVRVIKQSYKNSNRYKTIIMSIKSVGIIEPLVVFPHNSGKFLLMDGHLRYEVAKELGMETLECIVSTDDESFTYNAKINRIAPVQEHNMIMKAINNGVSAEKIASALNRTIKSVEANKSLLIGLDDETVDIIKDKRISIATIKILKRVTPVRQVEMAEAMSLLNNFSASYAKALLLATSPEFLTERERRRQNTEPKFEEFAEIGKDIDSMITNFKANEESYGERILHLTFMKSYIKRLLDNAKIVRYLTANHSDILVQFEDIAATDKLLAV